MQGSTTARLRAGAFVFALLASAAGCGDESGSAADASDAGRHDGGVDGDMDGGRQGERDRDGGQGDGGEGDAGLDPNGPDAQTPQDAGHEPGLDAGLDASASDGGEEAMDAAHADAGPGTEDASTDATLPDEGDGGDAGAPDAATEDAGPEACDPDGCPYGLCAGAACAVETVAANLASPRDLTLLGGRPYWVHNGQVRGCTTDPCASGGTLVWDAGAGHGFLGVVGQRVTGTDYLFTTDNQYSQGMWRVKPDVPGPGNSGADGLSSPPTGNAGPIAVHADTIVWGTQSRTYRTDATSLQTTFVMNVGPSIVYPTASGPTRTNVAVDADYVFASGGDDVYKCPIADTCTTNPGAAATTPLPNVVSLTIYDGTLYALGGAPFDIHGNEQIWSVPVTGGASSLRMEMTPGGSASLHSYTLLADEASLYWNSYNGNLYYCARVGTCEPTLLVEAAKAAGLTQDAEYLYWLNRSASTIERVKKP